MDNKTHVLKVRVTEAEALSAFDDAAARGFTLSKLVRILLKNERCRRQRKRKPDTGIQEK